MVTVQVFISQRVTLKTPYTIYVNARLPRVSLVFNLFMEVTFQCFQRLSKIPGDTEIKENPSLERVMLQIHGCCTGEQLLQAFPVCGGAPIWE